MSMTSLSSDSFVHSIQSEIERVTDDLKGVDENLKRLTGRDFNEPRGERRIRLSSMGGREDEPPPKRRPPGGVFARLGDPVSEPHRGRRVHVVSDEEGEIQRHKPSLASSVARPVTDGKSRTEAAAELTKDKASRERNRRMFGALLGTLQRFKTDEAKQKGKEEKRAKIEKKLEDKGRAEKEELQREKMELLNARKERQLLITRLHTKMERVKKHEAWEGHQRQLANFIRTQTKPRIFWIPKTVQPRTLQLVSATKEAICREVEGSRQRLKDELEEILGGRLDHAPMRDEAEQDTGREEGEGDNMEYNNGSDLLDYDAEEGELVYEDDLLVTGKTRKERERERVVVQVESSVNRAPQRRVELVTVAADRSKRGREGEWNESEKENLLRSKITIENRNGEVANVVDKGKGGRVKEREREKRHREKESKKSKDKSGEKKTSSDKSTAHSQTSPATVTHKDVQIKKESSKSSKRKSRTESESEKEKTQSTAVPEEREEGEEEEEEEDETWDADLSHISLPLEPEPAITEVVVQHVPMEGSADDTQDANSEAAEMQVETVLIDTSNIKKDKTEWGDVSSHKPILIIKQEKDASPPPPPVYKEITKPIHKDDEAKNATSSEDSSSDSDDSSSDSDEDEGSSNSSSDSSGSSSSSSDSDDEDKKKKKKRKEKMNKKKKKESSSSESESSSSEEEEEEDDDAKRSPQKKTSGREVSPRHGGRREKERQGGDKRREDMGRGRGGSRRSKSKDRRSRSRSRDRRRDRSRSKDRRRDRR